jgi:Fe(3+) dicitrate transport protein
MSGYPKRRAALRLVAVLGAAAALVLLPAVVSAQGAILRGVVREAETGAPLIDAQIRVVGTGLRTGTDAQGRFRLALPAGGPFEVQASRIGYGVDRRTVAGGVAGATELQFLLSTAPIRIPEVEVIGKSRTSLDRIPGSAEVVTQQRLVAMVPLTGNEVLRTLPGVHIQEEEGLGLRANVGIRGLNPDRSRTVLMLEDGVPVALNPYGEPEMYYTPPIDRMERVEVVKGSGSILFGPQTIGGVINYVTPSAPLRPEGSLSLQGGSGGYLRAMGSYGGTWNSVGMRLGAMHRRVADVAGLFADVTDVNGKFGFPVGRGSRVGVKLGVYDEVSNSTYVGLTEAMFREDPYRHPAPDDRLRLRRYSASATHDLALGAAATLRTTAYGYTTTRDWQRQDYVYSADGSQVLLRPTTGNRNRGFEVFGVEPRLQLAFDLGRVRNELDAGVRAQHEWAEDAHVDGSTPTARTGEVRDYEVRTGTAFSAFVQNRFFLAERFQVTPGLRVESYAYERNILRTRVRRVDPATGAVTRLPEDVDIRSGDGLVELIPGLGMTWNATDAVTVFAGAHRGFAPPRVKDALIYEDATVPAGQAVGDLVSLQLDAERSLNLELGVRAAPLPGVSLEATGFLLDFSNQIIPPSLSAGSVAQGVLANQGETRHAGIESSLGVDWGALAGWPLALTTQLRHTHVRSEFSADRFMVRGRDTVNVRGNRLPYAPENLWTVVFGVEHPSGLNLHLDGVRVDEQFTDNFETVAASANGRNGLIPAYSVWNAAASYRLPASGLTLSATVKNLTDATYIASRRPEGIRPGTPRLVQLGVRVGF